MSGYNLACGSFTTFAGGFSKRMFGRAPQRAIVFATSLLLVVQPQIAFAGGGTLPTGASVVQGNVTVAPNAGRLVVRQGSKNGIIDWQSFSIGNGKTVTVQNGSGATLNRVTGTGISSIDGKLVSTGSVYLINPAGIVTGPSGRIVTGGSFVGSTRDLSNSDFLAGNAQNFTGTSNGKVINNGSIIAKDGSVSLIGSSVINNGSVSAPQGVVAFAAGDEVMLDPGAADGRILVATSGGKDVANAGAITAAAAELTAAQGNVYALAGKSGAIHATGTATVAGHVWLTGGDTTEVASAITAINADGSGGTIAVTAPNVVVKPTARLIADGTTGGRILVGGDHDGGANVVLKELTEDLANAKTTTVEAGAILSAKGTTGNGGNVTIWSDDSTSFSGSILAGSDRVGVVPSCPDPRHPAYHLTPAPGYWMITNLCAMRSLSKRPINVYLGRQYFLTAMRKS